MLLDAWVDVRYWDALRLKVGQYLAPFGQERLTSDKFVKPVDRSMASTFIAPWYEVGIQLHGRLFLNRLSYAVMLANGNGISLSDENDDKELVARVFLRPWVNTTNPWLRGLQVGGAVTYGQQATASVAGMGPKTTPGTLVYSYADGTRRDGDRYRWSLQAAWHVGPFTLRGELMQMDERVKRTGAAVDVTHTGWYATAAYLLTGERQSFGRVTPRDPFDPHDPKGGWGAWELAARVGQIQYDKGDRMLILGGHGATQWIGGLNWYPNAAVRVSLQYQHASFRESIGGTDSEDTMFLRLQIEF